MSSTGMAKALHSPVDARIGGLRLIIDFSSLSRLFRKPSSYMIKWPQSVVAPPWAALTKQSNFMGGLA